jgi:hypothetical protein
MHAGEVGIATVPGKTCDDLADLGGIENDSDHLHPACALGTGHDVQFAYLGKQPCPGFSAGGCADVAVQLPALGLPSIVLGELYWA